MLPFFRVLMAVGPNTGPSKRRLLAVGCSLANRFNTRGACARLAAGRHSPFRGSEDACSGMCSSGNGVEEPLLIALDLAPVGWEPAWAMDSPRSCAGAQVGAEEPGFGRGGFHY